ncbi:hypothetical protein LWM68_27135 [Niabella sp. W65]|nr:hypothetical protein [Niabella sp. W65]MCH7366119.1 hypothetical protein [Niabella sp. W65]
MILDGGAFCHFLIIRTPFDLAYSMFNIQCSTMSRISTTIIVHSIISESSLLYKLCLKQEFLTVASIVFPLSPKANPAVARSGGLQPGAGTAGFIIMFSALFDCMINTGVLSVSPSALQMEALTLYEALI